MRTISSIDVTKFLVVNIPIAVAFVPPLGAVEIAMIGVLVNPDPSFKSEIFSIYQVPIVAVAVAVVPAPYIVRSVIVPISSILLSISSIPVSIVSSLYSNNSHCNS